jgi:hypothetical protein
VSLPRLRGSGGAVAQRHSDVVVDRRVPDGARCGEVDHARGLSLSVTIFILELVISTSEVTWLRRLRRIAPFPSNNECPLGIIRVDCPVTELELQMRFGRIVGGKERMRSARALAEHALLRASSA